MRSMKAAEVVLDFELYPRNNVDSHNVGTIIDAMVAGVELPPIIIDKKSKRVIDGFHRVKAHLRLLGDDARINVIEKSYKNEAAMFLDAMRYNASHGARLDPCDRTHCIIIAEKLGLTNDQIAGALNMKPDKLGALRADRMATSGGLNIALKRTVRHLAGQNLTERQNEANDKLSGMNQQFYANQLIELIESKMLDLSDAKLLERLRLLHDLLDGVLAVSK